jgi:hypothetical protein
MKKTILPLVLFLAILSMDAHAANRTVSGGDPKSPVVHNILSNKLPSKLLLSIKKDYKDYWITGLYTQDANGKTSYHMIVENADQTIELTATRATNWSVVRVTSKDQTNS